MIDKRSVFVLGAQDPEMREIAHVLRTLGRAYVHAAKDGLRVSPRTAYQADRVVKLWRGLRVRQELLVPGEPAIFVECTVRGPRAEHEPVTRIDHHNPGDPGYEMPPERYLEGASLGQTLGLLEVEPTPTQRLLAAADHCLTAAYQERCPGVDPRELLFLRASWRARVTGRTFGDVTEGILAAAKEARRRYDSEYRESVFLDPSHRAGGRTVYGNPHRGYAGAYLEESGRFTQPA